MTRTRSKPAPTERRAQRAEARAKIASLRERLRQALASKKQRKRELAAVLRAERVALRERLRANRKRALEELRAAARAEHETARAEWRRRRLAAREESENDVARARAELAAAERAHKAAHRQIDRAHRTDTARHARGAGQSQTDDEVRALIPPELAALFDRVKRSIRGGAGQTRAEAFLRYAERHPEETFKAVEPRGEEQIQAARAELEQATRAAARDEAFTLTAPPAVSRARGNRARPVVQQTLDLDATLWSTLGRAESMRGSEASSGGRAEPSAASSGAASKEAIGTAHEKIRKLRRTLENQERRFERGDLGKLTRAEAWSRMVDTGERIKAAGEAAARAESAYRTSHGRDYWQEGAT